MKQTHSSPSVLRDLGMVAGLYRNVAWMLGQRVQHGADWQQRLFEDAVRRDVADEMQPRKTGLRR